MCRDWYQFVICGCVWGLMAVCILRSYKLFTANVCTNAYFITVWESAYETYYTYLRVCEILYGSWDDVWVEMKRFGTVLVCAMVLMQRDSDFVNSVVETFCTVVGIVVKIIISTFLRILYENRIVWFYDWFCANSMFIMSCYCGYCCQRAFSAFVITFMRITFCAFAIILCK